MVKLYPLEDAEEIERGAAHDPQHAEYTGSERPWQVLALWDEMVPKFVKVYPERLPARDRDAEAVQGAGAVGRGGDHGGVRGERARPGAGGREVNAAADRTLGIVRVWPMETIHIFISVGRFRSFEEMRAFIDETYTEDGEGVPSAFMREVRLSGYEPACIEAIHSETVVPLSVLLRQASYSDQWLRHLDCSRLADVAICVFAPNRVRYPEGSSIEYCGAFGYSP